MSRLGLTPDCCLTSPRIRALDTARGACSHLGIEPEVVPAIGEGAYDSLELVAGRGVVLIVGHEPFLSAEVHRLTGGRVRMKKGGIAIVGPGGLEFLSGPKGLRSIAESD